MMALIIGIILIAISLGAFTLSGYIGADDAEHGATISFISFILFAIGLVMVHVNNPSAMDVYRGKTTLQITYKNNIPIDSTVVYK